MSSLQNMNGNFYCTKGQLSLLSICPSPSESTYESKQAVKLSNIVILKSELLDIEFILLMNCFTCLMLASGGKNNYE